MRAPTTATLGLTALGLLGALASCAKDPELVERPVIVFAPRECPISESAAYSVMYAGGDFEPSRELPPAASVFLRDVGKRMDTLPEQARSLVVDVSQDNVDWRGITQIPPDGPVHVLVWPGARPCHLTRDVERRTNFAFGVFGRHFMVAGGRSIDNMQVPGAFVGDLATGAIEKLAFGPSTRRSWATITAFHGGADNAEPIAALLAGGEDPDSGGPLASAEIYVPKAGAPGDVGDFDRDRIELSEPRSHHGAAVLATGETLLVGGVGNAGLLRSMEVVDPGTRRPRTTGVQLLEVARRDPTVLRLANGEILVAGGTGSEGAPVAKLEWFVPDASRSARRSVDLVTGRERAIVPLDGGGALAVILPPDESTNVTNFPTVWVIGADGTLEPGTPIDATTVDAVRLFRGADGAPILWTGRRWLRWSPWLARFQPIAGSPDSGPRAALRDPKMASGDAGLALWLDDDEAGMRVAGFRFATRTPYDVVPKPLLVGGLDQLAPDRLPTASTLVFEPERGLLLGERSSAFLTDVTFADVDVELDVTAAAPSIVLRLDSGPELEVGGATCAFARAATKHLSVRRRGRRVDVAVDDAPARPCPAELERGRVSIGVRGSQGIGFSGARRLVVTRR